MARKKIKRASTNLAVPNKGVMPLAIQTQAWQNPSASAFSPGQPMTPWMLEEKPRVFDYPPGINIFLNPRETYGLMPYMALRSLANMSDGIRIVIESIKREVRGLGWMIRPVDNKEKSGEKKQDYSSEIARLTRFWKKPDGTDTFDSWMNRFLHDMLVIDAPCLWLNTDEGGEITSVDVIDGSTIRPLMDERGKLPLPPVPAYIQMIRGVPAMWFTAEMLIYRPYNTSTQNMYGFSPLEWLVMRVNEALRRQLSHAEYWKETNVPEGLVALPETWTPEQIQTFQTYWDTVVAGNTSQQRRIRFVPSAGAGSVHEFKRPDASSQTIFDEFLIRAACWAYGFSPSELGITSGSGLGGKGFMEGGENSQMRLGILPLTQYIESLLTEIIQRQTAAPLEFVFTNIGPDEDEKQKLENLQMKLRNGVIDINDWRAAEGKEPIPDAKPFIVIGSQAILFDDLFNPKPPPPQFLMPGQFGKGPAKLEDETNNADGELDAETQNDAPEDVKKKEAMSERRMAIDLAAGHWREKIYRRMAEGKRAYCEPTESAAKIIPSVYQTIIRAGLRDVKAKSDVTAIFNVLRGQQPTSARIKKEEQFRDGLIALFAEQAKKCEAGSKEHALALTHPTDRFWAQFNDAAKKYLKTILHECASVGISEAKLDIHIQRAYTHNLPPFAPEVDWTLVNYNAEQWAALYAGELVTGLSEVTRKRIGEAVARWIENGNALSDLEKEIDEIISDPYRAFLIAITESTRAFAQGNVIAWKAQGVQGRRWYTAEDEAVCPLCGETLHGQVAPLGHSFPDGVDNPPAHPGCRCYLQPVLDLDNQE